MSKHRNGELVANKPLKSGYYQADFHVPEIARTARAGQFVHVRIEEGSQRILRRPFSIHDVSEDGLLSIVYKVVGIGTAQLADFKPGALCDLMGPLGNPYSEPDPDTVPVLVAGGYGSAALFLLAKNSMQKPYLLLGARSEADVILTDKYAALGCGVRVSTNDGSVGHKGFVTELLPPLMEELAGRKVKIYACGPHPMLMALAKQMTGAGYDGELSVDHLMCCGVGACFACVVKIKADTPEGWEYARSCKTGPVVDVKDV